MITEVIGPAIGDQPTLGWVTDFLEAGSSAYTPEELEAYRQSHTREEEPCYATT